MLRILLIPLVGLGAVLLLSGRFGGLRLPSDLAGLPVPMILFIAVFAVILVALQTLKPE